MKKQSGGNVQGGSGKHYQYSVLFEPQEGGYNVIVPAIPKDAKPTTERLAVSL